MARHALRRALLATALTAGLLPQAARAGDPPPIPAKSPAPPAPAIAVDDEGAKKAVAAYDEGAKDPVARKGALEKLAAAAHPDVADRLLRVAVGKDAFDHRAAAFRALGRQPATDAPRLSRGVAAWYMAEAKDVRKSIARGEYGLVMDRKTGDPILDTPEGKAALEAKRARGRVRAEAIALLRAWKHRHPEFLETVEEGLQDGDDGVVVACLGILADVGDRKCLKAVLELFQMYPLPNRWETGAVHDYHGTNASAKSKWMGKFGDPDKRRARPAVVAAIRSAAARLTGRPCDSPDALEQAMRVRERDRASR